MTRVYLDYNATTSLAPEGLDAMLPILRGGGGNASSIHSFGIEARLQLERARRSIERSLDAPRDSLVFTSGGSESNVLALFGVLDALPRTGAPHHVVSSPIEHKAVIDALRQRSDIELTLVSPDLWGRILPDALRSELRPNTALVSIMLANNEVGAISPIWELVSATRELAPAAHFHCDAVQGAGRIRVSCEELSADTFAFAAHKFHGPKGTGALVVRPGTRLARQIPGGGQERGLRAGTENVAGAVGMAAALALAIPRVAAEGARLAGMRERLWDALSGTSGIVRNSAPEDCLPGTLHVSLRGAEGRALVRELDEVGFAVSAGSACTSEGEALSHVLAGLYPDDKPRARGGVRISFGLGTSQEDLNRFAEAFVGIAEKVNATS